jgi:hypothetical protein
VFAESKRPTLIEAINDPDPERSRRAVLAALRMKKIDIAGIRKALDGNDSLASPGHRWS